MPAPKAVAISGSDAVARLNAQRAINGIPSDLTEDAALSEGCRKHETDYVGTSGQNPHSELPDRPGYSNEGDRAARSSDLAPYPDYDGDVWWSRYRNPWTHAPLHLAALFHPASTRAWYGDGPHGGCMGTSGSRSFGEAKFFSFPGPGTSWVPAEDQTGELPFTPAQALGVANPSGPTLLAWAMGVRHPRIASAALVSAGGDTPEVRWADPSTPSPASRDPRIPWGPTIGGDTGYVIPVHALRAGTPYTLTIDWVDDASTHYLQSVPFSTSLPDPRTTIESEGDKLVAHTQSPAEVAVKLRDLGTRATVATASLRNGESFRPPTGGGRFLLCIDQPASTSYFSADGCRRAIIVAPRFGRARVVGRSLVIPLRSSIRPRAGAKVVARRYLRIGKRRLKNLWPSTIVRTTWDKMTELRVPLPYPRRRQVEVNVSLRIGLSVGHLADEQVDAATLIGDFVLKPNRRVATRRIPHR
jgi:hypothetical protein